MKLHSTQEAAGVGRENVISLRVFFNILIRKYFRGLKQSSTQCYLQITKTHGEADSIPEIPEQKQNKNLLIQSLWKTTACVGWAEFIVPLNYMVLLSEWCSERQNSACFLSRAILLSL